MRKVAHLAFALLIWSGVAYAADPAVPTGRLPDLIKPTAYRLDLTVDPTKPDFSGRTEIDAVLARPTRTFFLHGKELRVSAARVTAGGKTVNVTYKEVDEFGVARIDAPSVLPAGKVTLAVEYTAGFREGAEGLFRAEVSGDWYAWTQLQPLDARRMFPSFDEPGFKTPFTVTITAPKAMRAFANAPEASHSASGEMIVHRFAKSLPLPTYLVAIGVGAFDVSEVTIAPNAVRKQPLAMRVIATKGQASRMAFAATETPKMLAGLEEYFATPYPYEKLDLIATPELGGAMENAGLIVFDDRLLLLDEGAPLAQVRNFADVMAHELAHQWFGDLVTPTWWTDIWLNEAFAQWMGKKIADRWRPELGLASAELSEAFEAMEADSLAGGRPIRQEITHNRQVAASFDAITYKKGAQVLAMFESYLGAEKVAQGIRLHLSRYAHGSATADDFFRSLSESARNDKIVPAMRTFTDQTGVPVITVASAGEKVTLTQERYRPLGIEPAAAQTWMIPVCLARGSTRTCALIENASTTLPIVAGSGALMPNASGSGYYRFRLDDAGWDRLIGAAATLPAREALALADSLWADFAAGHASFERVVAAARALSTNPERLAVLELGTRIRDLAETSLSLDQVPAYRAVMLSIYGPRLAAIGFDPAPGAHRNEPAEQQALRQSIVPLVALEGRDPKLRAQLLAGAEAYLAGKTDAIDAAFRGPALSVAVQERGAPFIPQLRDAMIKSTDPLFKQQASVAIGMGGTPELAQAALEASMGKGVQPLEMVRAMYYASRHPAARETVIGFVEKNFDEVMNRTPGFFRPQVITFYEGLCTAPDAARVEAFIKPRLGTLGGGDLELSQAKERITLCAALKSAKGKEIAAALGR